jgi:hypothetical protein
VIALLAGEASRQKLRFHLRAFLPLLALAVPLAACDRPTGDFGRAEPGILHDEWMPALGNTIADRGRGELVSDYNKTDHEKTLRDRAWSLVSPPNLNDWVGRTLVEYQRTRILPEMDGRFDDKAYYAILRSERYTSSETRWQRVIDDMRTDAQLVGPFWKEVRKVRADDDARMHTVDGRPDLTPGELHDAYARVEENARLTDWVWRAMRFRLKSYRICIDRMLIETPTERQWEINRTWGDLQTAIALAEQNTHELRFARVADAGPRPSRYTSPNEINEPVPQK